MYQRGEVSGECWELGTERIKKAFPKLDRNWFLILNEFLLVEGFSDERFKDAVNNLIRTCKYPEPTVAEILGYDRRQMNINWGYDD